MLIDVVIVCFNSDSTLLELCMASVRKSAAFAKVPVRIVLFDNGSSSPLNDDIVAGSDVRVIRSEQNLGFGMAANAAFRSSNGQQVLFLNPDAGLADAALSSLVRVSSVNPSALLVGWLEKENGSVQVDAFMLWIFSVSRLVRRKNYAAQLTRDSGEVVKVQKVSGGALFGYRGVLDRFGPFDERFFLYGEDADLSLRASKAGVELLAVRSAKVVHVGAASQKTYGVLVEKARSDAAIRLGAYHLNFFASLVQRLELAFITALGLLFSRTSSSSKRARWARMSEIARWGFARDCDRFSP